MRAGMTTLVFSHMALSCKDPLVIERFYTQYFGFQRARVVPIAEDQIVFIKSGTIYLELFRASKDAPVAPSGGIGPEYPGWRHLAFTVDNVDARLAEMGKDAIITLGPVNFDDIIQGWRTAWLADPEGNIVEISQGYSDQEHPPQLEQKENG
jgi:glyoxylase I family protein